MNEEEEKEKIESFSSMIDMIESSDDKKKFLWKEIFENAIRDRTLAYSLFLSLKNNMAAGADPHIQHGQTLAKYLAQMTKSNEQLLMLSKQIAESAQSAGDVSDDDIFEKIKSR